MTEYPQTSKSDFNMAMADTIMFDKIRNICHIAMNSMRTEPRYAIVAYDSIQEMFRILFPLMSSDEQKVEIQKRLDGLQPKINGIKQNLRKGTQEDIPFPLHSELSSLFSLVYEVRHQVGFGVPISRIHKATDQEAE